MGKGDKKTKRGKIIRGSYGNSRPKNTSPAYVASESEPAKKTAKRSKAKKA